MKRVCMIWLFIAGSFMAPGLGAAPVWAGGITSYEMGTPDVGLAAAG